MAVKLFGEPLVLFRDAQRRAAALVDRCAHRNVPLSVGRVVDGQLQCAYHGWCFDGAGAVQRIPALPGPPQGAARRVAAYATREAQGYVWVFAAPGAAPDGAPFDLTAGAGPAYTAVRYERRFQATLLAVLENILDVPHTAFLHGGLFRTARSSRTAQVRVRRDRDQVAAHFANEAAPRGLAGRLLAPGGGAIEHVDRFVLPAVAQVMYRLGRSHLLINNFCTPEDDHVTMLRTVAHLRLPAGLHRLAGPVLAALGRLVAAQDARILALQSGAVRAAGGERFASTSVDVMGGHILRLLRAAERGELAAVTPAEDHCALRL